MGSQRLPLGTPLISNDFRVAIEMSYELDVWGKYRSGALASVNDLTASRYYRETVRIGVAADVANAYFRLRAADAELGVLESVQPRDRHWRKQGRRCEFSGVMTG